MNRLPPPQGSRLRFLSPPRPLLRPATVGPSAAYHTPVRDRQSMKRQRTGGPHSPQFSERLSGDRHSTVRHALAPPLRPAAFRDFVLPPDFLPSHVLTLRAARYSPTGASPARFFLFQSKKAAAKMLGQGQGQGKGKDVPKGAPKDGQGSKKRPAVPTRPVESMLNFVQLLTAPTADTTGTAILAHYDNRRYIFGQVAEGTQRMFVQQKISLGKVEEVFLSGPINWQTAGGLLGMVLTLAETVSAAKAAEEVTRAEKAARARQQGQQPSTKKKTAPAGQEEDAPRSLQLHGGINLTQLLATARRFVFRKGLPLKPTEIAEDPGAGQVPGTLRAPDWADDNMMVWYVPVEGGEEESKNETETENDTTRKRPHEAMDASADAPDTVTDTSPETPAERAAADRTLVASVVQHMFDSDWQLDALVETTLHAAKLPAKLFVRDAVGRLHVYKGPLPGEAPDVPDVPVLVRQPWPAALIEELPRTRPARQSMCYIVRNHTRRGKVDPAALARHGVAKLDIRKLVAGTSVTATRPDDGTTHTVTPDMVVGPPIPGAGFAVVDLPDGRYVDGFLARPEFALAADAGAGGGSLLDPIHTVFWILGPGVAADPRLRAYMHARPTLQHVVAAPDVCANQLALASAGALQAKHHRIDPARFPLPLFDRRAPTVAPSPALVAADAAAPPPYQAARAGWSVRLAPQVVEEDDKVFPAADFGEALAALQPGVLALADAARADAALAAAAEAAACTPATSPPIPHGDVEVVALGTGSAMPSKYRNVSGTLVRVPGVGSYLFDCGENTLGSLRRMLGADGLADELRQLRAIWISHLHADHHLGTASVVRAWQAATAAQRDRRLLVASHRNMLQWLREYSEVEDLGLARLRLTELVSGRGHRMCVPVRLDPAESAEFGLHRIDACRVEHCHGALATVFTWVAATPAQRGAPSSDGGGPLRVAYSGDCRPSADFAQLGHNATLLIHESTFDDELATEALAKKHSTMGEALSIARHMGARHVLLTHFSQRYPKIPLFGADDGGGPEDMHVLVAFDHMRVRLQDFAAAAAFLPALQKLYEGEI